MTDASVIFENLQGVIVARIADQRISQRTGESLHAHVPILQEPESPPKVILDLSNITFIGSVGLTVLVVFLKRISTAGGQLAISGLEGEARRVMAMTRLENVFQFYEDVEQAASALLTA